jgi:hypothetical protein
MYESWCSQGDSSQQAVKVVVVLRSVSVPLGKAGLTVLAEDDHIPGQGQATGEIGELG